LPEKLFLPEVLRHTADSTYWRCWWNLTRIIGVYSGTQR